MKQAMLNKETVKLLALRLVRAEFLKAEKERGEKVTEERAMQILQSMIKQRRDSIEQYTAANRSDLAENEKKELDIIAAYLPKSLTPEEIAACIDATFAELGDIMPRQAGKVIGLVMKKLRATNRPFDAKSVNEFIHTKLDAKAS